MSEAPRRWWPGPSLLQRVVWALLWAFVLVWCALLARDYLNFKEKAFNQQALHAAAALAEILPPDETVAALTVRVTESVYNRSRRVSGLDGVGELLFVLTSVAASQPVYTSPALAGQALPSLSASTEPIHLPGLAQAYWLVVRDTPQWHLWVLEPVISDTSLLRWLSQDQLEPMLLAFPFVLLPLWLAVWRGLRPLREFAARVAARDPADVSALGLDLRHAELRPLVHAFDQLLDKARQSMSRERAFVQDAAHELRTPLAVVTTQAHALTEATSPQTRQEAKTALERAVARASHLVHQLLSLARADGAQRKQRVNLVEVTRQVLIAAGDLAAQRQIEVSLASPERLEADMDVEAFFSIVDNLLRNALTYCPTGARAELQLAPMAPDDSRPTPWVCLTVQDDGPGIAPQDAPHIFERFHRGRNNQASGSGLGLAIVRQATQTLGGTVTLSAGIAGRGARFTVELPVGAQRP